MLRVCRTVLFAFAVASASAFTCVVCPAGQYHVGCNVFTKSGGSCTPCTNKLPANAAYVAAGLAKQSKSCPWQCNPSYVEAAAGAFTGPACIPSVGGSAGLKALEASPSASLGGGVALAGVLLPSNSGVGRPAAAPGLAPSPVLAPFVPVINGVPLSTGASSDAGSEGGGGAAVASG